MYVLIFGKLNSEGVEEEHAYNIFKMKDGTLILFDSTNPVFLTSGFVPAYSIIGKKDINDVESVSFDFAKLTEIYGKPLHPEEVLDRNYITCNYYLKEDNPKLK